MKVLKKLGIIGVLFAAVMASQEANATTLTGTIKYADGTGVTGRLLLHLPQSASQLSAGGCGGPALLMPVTDISITLTNGSLVAPPAIVGIDCLLPGNMYYVATVKDAQGNNLTVDQWSITGASFDVGTVVPSTVNVAFSGAVLLSPPSAADQSIAGSLLASGSRNLGNSTTGRWNTIFGTIGNFSSSIANGGVLTQTGDAAFAGNITGTAGKTLTGFGGLTVSGPSSLGATTATTINATTVTAGPLVSLAATPAAGGFTRAGSSEKYCWKGVNATGDNCLQIQTFNGNLNRLQIAYETGSPLYVGTNLETIGGAISTTTTSNTVAETSLFQTGTIVITATGGAFRAHVNGTLTNTSGSPVTYTLRARLDNAASGTVLCVTPAVSVSTGTTNAPFRMDCNLTPITTGAGGTSDAYGEYNVNASQSDTAGALATVDTTATHTIFFTMQMGTANASASFTPRSSFLNHYGSN